YLGRIVEMMGHPNVIGLRLPECPDREGIGRSWETFYHYLRGRLYHPAAARLGLFHEILLQPVVPIENGRTFAYVELSPILDCLHTSPHFVGADGQIV
ncbi:MAG: hypothetical protein AVDCRST_MAG93-3412, partial [uncultured Chloroflexia bacterium]